MKRVAYRTGRLLRTAGSRAALCLVAALLLSAGTAFAQDPVEFLDTWTDPGTAGWTNSSAQTTLSNPGGYLNLAFLSQTIAEGEAAIAVKYLGQPFVATNISFRFNAAGVMPSAVRIYFHSGSSSNSWYISLPPPSAGGWMDVNAAVNAYTRWVIGPGGTPVEQFNDDVQQIDWIGVYVRRNGDLNVQNYMIDDFLVKGYTPPPSAAAPTVQVTLPFTTNGIYVTTNDTINLAGTANGSGGVVRVSVANNRDLGTNTSSGTYSWMYNGLQLYSGLNYIRITVTDGTGNQSTSTLAVNYTADTLYEDVLRAGSLVQEINFPDNLTPGDTVAVRWKLLSYVPIRACLGARSDPAGSWTLFRNGVYRGVENSTWHISNRYASVYSFDCSWTVPQNPGNFIFWITAAQTDGGQYMTAVVPAGADPLGRYHPTIAKTVLRTIASGGTNLNPQSETIYSDYLYPFETLDQHKKHSGASVVQVNMPTNSLIAGSVVTCQWKVLGYEDFNSQLVMYDLAQQKILMMSPGTETGAPSNSTWHFKDFNGTTFYATENLFTTSFTVTNQPGRVQFYFVNQERTNAASSWMAGNMPANVDPHPVLYNGLYGRLIERIITNSVPEVP